MPWHTPIFIILHFNISSMKSNYFFLFASVMIFILKGNHSVIGQNVDNELKIWFTRPKELR